MERINFGKYEGFESIDSSQLMSIHGGAAPNWFELIRWLAKLVEGLGLYKDDFWKGFKEGFDLI